MKSYGTPRHSPLSVMDRCECARGCRCGSCIILTFAAKQGHNVGLKHHNNGMDSNEKGDGFKNDATSWAPLMGASYGAHVSSFHYNTKNAVHGICSDRLISHVGSDLFLGNTMVGRQVSRWHRRSG